LKYIEYVQSCLDWGDEQKQFASEDKEIWKDYKWNEEKEIRDEFISRLKKARLVIKDG